MKKLFLITSLLVGLTTIVASQNRTVKGHVYAFKELKLNNVNVTAKKSKQTTVTDIFGNFTIECAKKDKIVFEGEGFSMAAVKISKKDSLTVKLIFDGGASNEKRAIDSNHASKEELVYAIRHHSDYNNDFYKYGDIYSLLNGELSGLSFVDSGNGTKQIIIGGPNSLTQSYYALLIVDDVIVHDISNILPEKVTEVKMARTAAKYGARGANGAVYIYTKK